MPDAQHDPKLPLAGLAVVEFSSIAPAPFGTMILSDFGADVILIERPGGTRAGIELDGPPILSRGKRSIVLDLSDEADLEVALELTDRADVVVEGYRPGVMERLGLGPDRLRERNPGLIYARVSGWGQEGPYAQYAGHDINYLSVAGPLGLIGSDRPTPPSAFVGDFAGGSLTTVIGILLALQARHHSGRGQVVDAAIVDGVAQLMTPNLELHRHGLLKKRGANMIDGNAPFYGVYECADGGWVAVGAIEGKFYRNLLDALGFDDELTTDQHDETQWPALRARIADKFKTKSRDEWARLLGPLEACASPVLEVDDLVSDPHLKARGLFTAEDGLFDSRPAPMLSDSPGRAGERLLTSGQHSNEIREQLKSGTDFPRHLLVTENA